MIKVKEVISFDFNILAITFKEPIESLSKDSSEGLMTPVLKKQKKENIISDKRQPSILAYVKKTQEKL